MGTTNALRSVPRQSWHLFVNFCNTRLILLYCKSVYANIEGYKSILQLEQYSVLRTLHNKMKMVQVLSPLLLASASLGLKVSVIIIIVIILSSSFVKVSVEEEKRVAPPPAAGTRLFFNWCDFYKGNCVSGCSRKAVFIS